MSSEIKFCTTKISNLQNDHRNLTRELFAQNSTALGLRISRESAELAHKIAPAYAKAATAAALQAVKILQKSLVLYQQSILYRANISSYNFLQKMFTHQYMVKQSSTGLIVEAYPEDSDSPSYKLEDDYLNKKTLIFYKKINLTKKFPKILLNHFHKYNRPLTPYLFKCGGTIKEQGGEPSDIKLILDK